ncbi:hypothetical protein ACFQBN_20820 [Cohnella cellulosilytica]
MFDDTGRQVLEKTTSYLYDDNGNQLRSLIGYLRPNNPGMRQVTGGDAYGESTPGDANTVVEKSLQTFDGFNRLVRAERVKAGEQSIVTYQYDGDDLRTQKGLGMRLIGSKTEQDLRKQLIESNKLLFEGQGNKSLLKALEKYYPEMKTAYILHWIPEQGEDIYKVLVNDSTIVEVELDRNDIAVEPLVSTISISQYRQGLSKHSQIKLEVALDLVQAQLKGCEVK